MRTAFVNGSAFSSHACSSNSSELTTPPSAAQSATALALSLLSNTGSTLENFLQSGVGALLRSLQSKLRETISLTDLTPTIVELAGFQAPTELDGHSIADAITGKRESQPDTGSAFAPMIS